MSTQLFLRSTAGTPVNKPASNLSSWGVVTAAQQGINSRALSITSGVGGSASSPNQALAIGASTVGNLTALSDTIAAQAISSQTITIGVSTQYKSAVNGTCTVRTRVAVYLIDGTSGAIKSTILGLTALGAAAPVTTTVNQFVTNFSNSFVSTLVTAATGDYIAIDLGHQCTMTANDTVNVGIDYDGSTAIVADNAVGQFTSQSFITFTNTITFGSGTSGGNSNEPDAYAFQQGLYIPLAPIGAI